MFIRQCYRKKNGKRHAYWALVESYRTSRGPRQRIISYLGEMDARGRLGIRQAATGQGVQYQRHLFDNVSPRWVEVDTHRIRLERCVDFGGPWLATELLKHLGLESLLKKLFPVGREEIEWSLMVMILVICRLCNPSSELHIAEHLYGHTVLGDLLGIAPDKINDDRLYRALDQLLPHKEAFELHLKERLGELFGLEYDILLYDVTSTYFEGQAKGNDLAQRGYSRDHRGDCKQVCIGLVVSKCGMPLGYEIFAGNRHDSTTVEEIVETMERRYGKADRIWVMDRGMVSQENIDLLKEGRRRYIIGTPKSMLRNFAVQIASDDWDKVHEGLEVQRCQSPDGSDETFILCRSQDRRKKEQAIHERFEKRIEEGLKKIEATCSKRKCDAITIAKRVGRLLGQNSRAAGLFETNVIKTADGRTKLLWHKVEAWRNWAALSEGCYLLRSNINDWSGEELWKAYMQLTDAEAAFRIHKSDLKIRPIWHQKTERVQAHILVCFLAYVLWKTLAKMCKTAGLGDEPRRVFEELAKIKAVDVILPTRSGTEIRRRCICRPTEHQAILLHHLGLVLPTNLPLAEKILKTM
jgi:transposase